MGRPTKEGLDYFSLDTEFNSPLKRFIVKFGNRGLGSLIRIWQFIYRTNGYYIHFDEDTTLTLADEIREDTEYLHEIIEYLIEKDIFSKSQFSKNGILTSVRLQENYLTATKKRLSNKINPEFLLEETELMSEETAKKREESTQSKVKYIKVNNIKPPKPNLSKEISEIFKNLQELGVNINSMTLGTVDLWREKHSKDMIIEAIKISNANNVRKITYIDAILSRFYADGINVPDQIQGIGKTKDKAVEPEWFDGYMANFNENNK